ncbi:MAG: type II secretion system F family protein [Bacteriovoracaceae bacterium]
MLIGFLNLIGERGLIGLIGFLFFVLTFRYSKELFVWIENQTIGTRSYILEKLEFLHLKVKEEHITYLLLSISVGSGAITLIFCGAFGLWLVGVLLGGIVMFLGFKVPKPIINFMVARRIKAYQNQMVDGLQLLANGIRAGLSVPQAIGMVVDELSPPVSQEFNGILQQNKIGVPLEECFESLVKRIPTEDNEMFVSSVNILRETGGNLAEVFDTIVEVIRERIRLQQKIDTFTAQGMFQGITIALMPFVMAGVYAAADPQGMLNMVTHPVGIALLVAALLLDLIGIIVILKIVNIKI